MRGETSKNKKSDLASITGPGERLAAVAIRALKNDYHDDENEKDTTSNSGNDGVGSAFEGRGGTLGARKIQVEDIVVVDSGVGSVGQLTSIQVEVSS